MASEEGSVIVCHTMDELDAQLAKADESGKLEVDKIYEIRSIPTFFFIRNGETLESFATVDEDKLRDTIKKYYYLGTTPASAASYAA